MKYFYPVPQYLSNLFSGSSSFEIDNFNTPLPQTATDPQ
jgi:hypothetical protein